MLFPPNFIFSSDIFTDHFYALHLRDIIAAIQLHSSQGAVNATVRPYVLVSAFSLWLILMWVIICDIQSFFFQIHLTGFLELLILIGGTPRDPILPCAHRQIVRGVEEEMEFRQ